LTAQSIAKSKVNPIQMGQSNMQLKAGFESKFDAIQHIAISRVNPIQVGQYNMQLKAGFGSKFDAVQHTGQIVREAPTRKTLHRQ
jgi:hypothetical protein